MTGDRGRRTEDRKTERQMVVGSNSKDSKTDCTRQYAAKRIAQGADGSETVGSWQDAARNSELEAES